MTGLLVCADFFFTSKVTGTAEALGVTMYEAATQQAAEDALSAGGVGFVLLDLSTPGLDVGALVNVAGSDDRPQFVGFDSHVNTQRMQSARDAGCDDVMPKSRFSSELPALLQRFQ